jgi:SAM-dependent methyltransferase
MRNRPLDAYERLLQGAGPAGMPLTTLVDGCRILNARMAPLTIVDLGCGGGQAILSLVASARSYGIEATGIGIDKEITNSPASVAATGWGTALGVASDGTAAVTSSGFRVCFIRGDLDDDWPLRERSVHLAISSKSAMFLKDKIRFLERVWASLVPDGLAILELDVGDLNDPSPRIRTPKPLRDLVHEMSARGFGISMWQADCPLADTTDPANLTRRSCVLGMRRNRCDVRLSFGL